MTRHLLRLFPAAWRARYGEELLDLVDETGLTPRAAFDVARAGLAERARVAREALTGGTSVIVGPAWRHPTAWAVAGAVVLLPTLIAIAFPVFISSSPLYDQLTSQRVLDLAIVLAPALAALLAGVPLVRLGYSRVDLGSEASLSVRLRAANMVVVIVGLGISCFFVGHILFESVMQVGS